MATLQFVNWRQYQGDRRRETMPWLKLYVKLLDSYEFINLPEVTQAHAFKLMLLARKLNNQIPDDPAYIKTAIRAQKTPDISALIACGLLSRCEQDARDVRASGAQNTALEEERDIREESPKPPLGGGGRKPAKGKPGTDAVDPDNADEQGSESGGDELDSRIAQWIGDNQIQARVVPCPKVYRDFRSIIDAVGWEAACSAVLECARDRRAVQPVAVALARLSREQGMRMAEKSRVETEKAGRFNA
jgi:hypothetical protein